MRSLSSLLALGLAACSGAASPGVESFLPETLPEAPSPAAPTPAEAPTPTPAPSPTPAPEGPKRVFLTVNAYKGDFRAYARAADGFEAADAICAKEAADAKLGGAGWKAYLSGRRGATTIDASTRIVGSGPWLSVDGKTTLFETRANLTTKPGASIKLQADGKEWDSGGPWTGTSRGVASQACEDASGASWQSTSNRARGVNGDPRDVNKWMDDGSPKGCDQTAPLYCFEQ